jgi:hypothetical protein
LQFSVFHLKEEDWETVLKADTEFEPNVPSSGTPTGKWQIVLKPIPAPTSIKYTLLELSYSMKSSGKAGGLPKGELFFRTAVFSIVHLFSLQNRIVGIHYSFINVQNRVYLFFESRPKTSVINYEEL